MGGTGIAPLGRSRLRWAAVTAQQRRFYLGASGAASAWAHPRRVIRLGWGEVGWCAV